MQEDILSPTAQNKVYKEGSMAIAILLGGPFVVGYLMAHNFRQFGQLEKVRKTWLYSTFGFLAIAGVMVAVPESLNIPNIVYNLVFAMIALYFVQKYQGQQLKQHIEEGGAVYSNWRAAGIGLLCMLVIVILLVIFFLLSDAAVLAE